MDNVWKFNLSLRLNQTNDCSLLQKMVYDALLGTSRPDYVASFGNSDVYNAADWVKIIDERDETVLQAVIQSSVSVN